MRTHADNGFYYYPFEARACQALMWSFTALTSPPRAHAEALLFSASMSRTRTAALRGALRSLRARPTEVQQQRLFAASARCQNDPKPQQSFKSQLYESTQQRLKRERAEQERFAQYQTQPPGGRYAALMFGTSRNKPALASLG